MSCGLEFLSIDLSLVQNFFASGDSAIYQTLIAQGREIFNGDEDDEETQEERFVWEEIIRSLSGGKLGKYLAGQKPLGTIGKENDSISEMKALAVRSVVRYFGQSIAAVFHSTNSGELFCSEPFEYLNQSGFIGRTDSFLLLQRPLFNQIHFASPSWGGLTRVELLGIPIDNLAVASPDSGDTDVDSWVCGILNLVEEAKLQELDLVTIYE